MANSVDLGSVVARLELDVAGFQRSIDDVKNGMSGVASHTQKSASVMGSALDNVAKVGMAGLAVATAAATALMVTSIGAAVKRVDTLDNSARTFENMGIKASDAKEATKRLTESILGLPTPLDAAVRGMTDLTATYGDVNTGQRVFSALNNAILGFGGTADSVRNAVTQLSQLPMDGPLDGQTWLSLRNSGLTPVLVAMAKDMGIGVAEMRAQFGSGQLTVRDFTDKLVEMNEKGGGGMKSLQQIARDSTKGIGTSIENMKTAVTRGMASVLRAIGTQDIARAITAIGSAFENALKESSGFIQFIKNNKDFITPIILAFTSFVAVTTLAWGAIKVGTALWKAFNLVLATNPFILVAIAVIALTAGLAYFFTQTETGRKVWARLTESFSKFWEVVKPIRNFIGDQLISAFDSLKSIWNQLVTAMQPLIDMFQEFWSKHGEKVMTVLKYIGIAVAGIFLAPLVASFALLMGALKVIAVVLGFVADHFDIIKKVVIAMVLTALSPFLVVIGLVILAFKAVVFAVQLFWSLLTTVFSGIVAVVVPVITFIKDIIVGYFTIWWNVVSAILGFMKDLFVIVFGSILIVVLTIFGAVRDFIVGVWQSVWAFIQPIIQTIVDFFKERFETAKNNVMSIFNALKDFISGVWGTIYNIISGIVQRLINFFAPAFSWLLERGKDIIRGLTEGIKSVGGMVWEAIKAVADKIGQFFSNAGSWLYNVGRDIVTGLINGIKSMVGAVSGAAGDVGNAVKSKLKSVLGIGSPSKITAQYGVWVGEGFNNGLEGMQRTIGKTLGETFALAPSALENLSGTFNAGLTVPKAGQVANGKEVNQTNSSNLTINGNINISNQADADYLLSRLSRRQDLTVQGLVGA